MNPTVKGITQNPRRIHEVPDYELELTVREVLEELIARARRYDERTKEHKSKRREFAEWILRFIGEVYKRKPIMGSYLVTAYARMDGDVCSLIRAAVKLKKDPEVGPYLTHLKTTLAHHVWDRDNEQFMRGRHYVRKAEERGCMWAGLSTKETRRCTEHIVPRR